MSQLVQLHDDSSDSSSSDDDLPMSVSLPDDKLLEACAVGEAVNVLSTYELLLQDQMTTSSIDKWSIFSMVRQELANRIRLAAVFGCTGNEAIFVTEDDEAFGFGTNASGCLGVNDPTGCLQPKKIETLSGVGVKSLAYGSGPHVMALTESGAVFAWGHNGYQQLGNGTTSQGLVPTEVSGLLGQRVVQVCCGAHHTLALTATGDVFAWGQNNCGQVGSGSTANQPTPRKVTAGIGSRRAVAIACGQIASMAVLDNGELYAWGYNGNGQLGLGTNANQTVPTRVNSLGGVNIRRVACGYAHALALAADGSVYAWGSNTYGQLGTGGKTNQMTPVKVGPAGVRFVEVAASHYNHLSVGLSDDGQCWVWGQCRTQSVVRPVPVPVGSVHDVFAGFGHPAVTWKPITVRPNRTNRVNDRLSAAFDDPKSADLRFTVDGRTIHVHKSVLKIQCQHFRSMFEGQWSESNKDVIEVNLFSYPVYHAFLRYIYTDEVDLPPDQAISLLDLANSYCEIDLKNKCQQLIRRGISIDNVATVYAAAIKFEAKELEDYCFQFILVHLTAVVQTEAFRRLDEENTKNLIVKAARHGVFKY